MYTRQILPAPTKPVIYGVPQFGSFSGSFERFDIKGMKRPFGDLPLPVFLTNVRIMEFLRFLICNDELIGEIEMFNAGYFSFMETTLWNRKTNLRVAYRHIVPFGMMHFPQNFGNSVTACRSHSRYVRIHSRISKKIIHADFDLLGSDPRPSCEGRLEMNLAGNGAVEHSSVIPYGVRRRALASYQVVSPLLGWISTGKKDTEIVDASGVGFFDVRKAYFSMRTKISKLIGLSRYEGRLIAFQLGNSVYHDDYNYNDNILFVDGVAHPLPPVKITRPYGITGAWFIQDTESMVDLIFNPISDSERKLSAFILRTDYHTVYGSFEGVLLTTEGEKIVLKNFPGIGKKILLRL